MNSLFLLPLITISILCGTAAQDSVAISSDPAAASSVILKIYNVSDLVQQPGMSEVLVGKKDHSGEMAVKTRNLAELIRKFIQPPLTENSEDVKAIGTESIVAQALPSKHLWIESFLAVQRKARHTMFLVDITYVTMSDMEFKKQAAETNPSINLVDHEIKTRIEQWKKSSESNIVTTPRILLTNMEKGTISSLNQIAYLSGYKVHAYVEPMKTRIVDPVIEVAENGFIFEVRAVQLEDDRIGMTISSKHMAVPRPIPTMETEYGPISVVTVEKVEMATTIIVKNNGSMIYSIPGKKKGGNNHLLLLTVRKVTEKDLPGLKR